MKIEFILSGTAGSFPGGGVRVIFEHANKLAEKGHTVTLWYCFNVSGCCSSKQHPWLSGKLQFLKRKVRNILRGRVYSVHKSIKEKYVVLPSKTELLGAEAVIATSWRTAELALTLIPENDRLYHLIQGYEPAWEEERERICRVYSSHIRNIVVSEWLIQRLRNANFPVYAYVPNGLDSSFFRPLPVKRTSRKIGMMYSTTAKLKACNIGIEAMNAVHDNYPDIGGIVVGADPRPAELPAWIDYLQKPGQDKIRSFYNNLDVFISSSDEEGFGLPGAEALACGCALATTDSGGVRDYAIDGETALLSPPRDFELLRNNIIRLLLDDNLAQKTAEHGRTLIVERFNWERASAELEKILSGRLHL